MGSYRAIGEFPLRIVPTLIGGEGIRYIFLVRQHMETHKGVYGRPKGPEEASEPLVQA